MAAILTLTHIHKQYATHKAVNNLSLTIEKGSIFGLLGPNGAGKTTLLRMITGIYYPDSGKILFNGKSFNPSTDNLKIGYMPEERGLYKKMKIGEQALYLAQLKGLSKQDALNRINFWFDRLEMGSWWNKKVEDLSKGMSQKLQFVTTVLHEPELIILDEPFSGLDPINANIIKQEISHLANNGCTIIFSTHRMEQVEEICTEIALLNLGKKIAEGTVTGIKQQFKANQFKIQLQEAPSDAFNNEIFTTILQQNKLLIVAIKNGHNSNDVLRYLIEKNYIIESFQEILPTLNDIFIQLVTNSKGVTQSFEPAFLMP